MKKSKAKLTLTIIALAALAILIYATRDQFVEAWRLIGRVNLFVLIGGIVGIQIYSYYANAQFYQSLYEVFGTRISKRKLFDVSLALNFVNVIFPTLGASGITYISYALKDEAPKGQSAFGQLSRYILTYLSFVAMLFVGGMFLYFGGGISRLLVRIIVLLVLGIIALSVIFFYLLINKRRMNQAIQWTVKAINAISRKFRKFDGELIAPRRAHRALNDFHNSFDKLWQKKRNLVRPLWYAFLGNLAEIATVYIVFIAMGIFVNPGAVIIAYALATLAGVITFVPGSIGLYESIMVAGLSATGLSLAVSLSATLLYRITNMAIFLPIGYVIYERLNRQFGISKKSLQQVKHDTQ